MPKAKSAAVKSGHQTKAEKAARLDAEEQLRGDAVDTLEPPEYLNDRQRQIFREVFALLKRRRSSTPATSICSRTSPSASSARSAWTT